jgi:anti-anti-sigma regulatory factor
MQKRERSMFSTDVVQWSDVAVVQCQGRLVRSDAAYSLRNAVIAQASSRTIVLDLSLVSAIEGGGLGMLVFLQRWTKDNGIELRLFNPCSTVRHNLERAAALCGLEMISQEPLLSTIGLYEKRSSYLEYLAA